MAFRARGRHGALLVGGRRAATLATWRLEGGHAWTCTGTARDADDFWLSGPGPFELRLDLGNREWRWRPVSLEKAGPDVVITGQGAPLVCFH